MREQRIRAALWDRCQLAHLLEALGERGGLRPRHNVTPRPPVDSERLGEWFDTASGRLGMEASAVDVRAYRVEESLRAAAPAVIPIAEEGYLALLDAGRSRATLLLPGLSTVRVPLEELRRFLCLHVEAPHRLTVDRLLEECGIGSSRRARAGDALLRERTRYQRAALIYTLRKPPGAGFLGTVISAGLGKMLGTLLAAHVTEYLLLMGAWWVLGRAVLQGQIDSGVLAAWALLLATIVPFRILASSLQGRLAIGLGGLLRERLLDGALKLHPGEVRHEGAGAFLGRAIEAEQVETMAISGGTIAALALLETILSLGVLGLGAGAWLQFLVLAAWICLAVWLAYRYYVRRDTWTGIRLDMTGSLIEAMTGHRTRLAQQHPKEWHEEEDRCLERYAAVSRAVDGSQAWMGTIPRGYLVTALIALAPEFLAPTPSTALLAVSLGAIIIAWQAFRRMTGGLAQICGAIISWKRVSDLFHASAREDVAAVATASSAESATVISAREIAFRYDGAGRTIFSGVNLDISRGDWLLLEGSSGGGKSTLVSLLTGLSQPATGLILAGGFDLRTLGGRQWRRRIASAPQYHDNHVLGNTFAFNLLMGRGWPPSEDDLRQAGQICRELGLGPLLERMPAGLFQMVGETGWQLSQGERSRLFLARALLQKPEMVVLDESFAALDPETLRQALECTLRRAETLLVVAHP